MLFLGWVKTGMRMIRQKCVPAHVWIFSVMAKRVFSDLCPDRFVSDRCLAGITGWRPLLASWAAFAMNPASPRDVLSSSQPAIASWPALENCMLMRSGERPRWFSPKFKDLGIACFIISNLFFLSWKDFRLVNKNECVEAYQKKSEGWDSLSLCDLSGNLLPGLCKYLNWINQPLFNHCLS